jgi:hypothetical protein
MLVGEWRESPFGSRRRPDAAIAAVRRLEMLANRKG